VGNFTGNGAGLTNIPGISGRTNWSVSSITNAGTAAYSNATAFALAQSGTIVTQNNSFALVLSNTVNMDAAHILSLSNLTASRIVLSGADNGLASAAASGAVPVDANGSATTFSQVNALSPGYVVTNNNVNAFLASNNIGIDAAHSLSLSNLTASRITMSGADKSLSSAAASGAVPIDADGSASTAAQVNTLFPSAIVTNGFTPNMTFAGNLSVSGTHVIQTTGGSSMFGAATSVGLNAYEAGGGGTYYLSAGAYDNDTWGFGFSTSQGGGTLQSVLLVATNKIVTVTNVTAASSYGQFRGGMFAMPTNYVAANFTPVAGMVIVVPSNGVLYKVTQLSTNLLSSTTP